MCGVPAEKMVTMQPRAKRTSEETRRTMIDILGFGETGYAHPIAMPAVSGISAPGLRCAYGYWQYYFSPPT